MTFFKRLMVFMLCIILMVNTTSCGNNQNSVGDKIYYIRTDKAGIIPRDYAFENTELDAMISEALDKLKENVDDINILNTIPAGVEVKNWELNDGNLSLFLVGDYEALDTYTEILVRAAIVKTLVQINGVDSVSIFVNNSPLTDSNGESIGQMTSDTFIEDFGQETDSLLSTELILYFSSANGVNVIPENRDVYYSSNVSLERLVIEQLLKGPESSDLLSAIPNGTKLNSITVSEDGVCIVNFDGAIETTMTGITENVTVYSIVNSLTELANIKSVQILVNGNTPHLSNVEVDLSTAISRNEDIINVLSDEEEEQLYIEEDDDFVITEE